MEPGGGPERAQEMEHRTPRWVKVFAVVAGLLVVLLVFAVALGDGEHGPGRHAPSRDGPLQGGAAAAAPADVPVVAEVVAAPGHVP